LSALDRLFWTVLRETWARWEDVLVIVKPENSGAAGIAIGIEHHLARQIWLWLRTPGLSAQILTEQNRSHLRLYTRGAIIMFETAVQEKRTGIAWGIIMGVVALAVLLGAGYMLIT
jgi:hypothetical protein